MCTRAPHAHRPSTATCPSTSAPSASLSSCSASKEEKEEEEPETFEVLDSSRDAGDTTLPQPEGSTPWEASSCRSPSISSLGAACNADGSDAVTDPAVSDPTPPLGWARLCVDCGDIPAEPRALAVLVAAAAPEEPDVGVNGDAMAMFLELPESSGVEAALERGEEGAKRLRTPDMGGGGCGDLPAAKEEALDGFEKDAEGEEEVEDARWKVGFHAGEAVGEDGMEMDAEAKDEGGEAREAWCRASARLGEWGSEGI